MERFGLICRKNNLNEIETKLLNHKNMLSKLLIDNKKLLYYSDFFEESIANNNCNYENSYHEFILSILHCLFYSIFENDKLGSNKVHIMQKIQDNKVIRGIFVHNGSVLKVSLPKNKLFLIKFNFFLNNAVIDKVDAFKI